MAEDTKDAVRKMRKTVGGIAESAPVLQISKAIERVGETVSEIHDRCRGWDDDLDRGFH